MLVDSPCLLHGLWCALTSAVHISCCRRRERSVASSPNGFAICAHSNAVAAHQRQTAPKQVELTGRDETDGRAQHLSLDLEEALVVDDRDRQQHELREQRRDTWGGHAFSNGEVIRAIMLENSPYLQQEELRDSVAIPCVPSASTSCRRREGEPAVAAVTQ